MFLHCDFVWKNPSKTISFLQVGEVVNFDLFKNEKGLSRGCGIVEFDSSDLARKAIGSMDKFLWMGRKMYVKKSEDVARDEFGRIISGPMARYELDEKLLKIH